MNKFLVPESNDFYSKNGKEIPNISINRKR